MMRLILTTCLTIPSYAWREHAVTIYEDMNQFQCAVTGQPRVVSAQQVGIRSSIGDVPSHLVERTIDAISAWLLEKPS